MSDFTGAVVPESDFADDDGAANPRLRVALSEYAQLATAECARRVLDLLVNDRLLVPVVAQIDSMDGDSEKDSHMEAVEFHSVDGRKALLAFTGTDSLEVWDPQARPIPRASHIVAKSVLEQNFDALIIDIAGPVPTAIDGMLLNLLAIGPNREELLDDALDEVCLTLSTVDGIDSASWDDTDEEVTITLYISAPTPTLSNDVAAVIQASDLNALLDRPLEVQVAGK